MLRALKGIGSTPVFSMLEDAIQYIDEHPLHYERVLRDADAFLVKDNTRFLLLFDALDRMSRDWAIIRSLSREMLRMTLDLSGYKAIRAKIFMRVDQFGDVQLFDFQDASKLKTSAVNLNWARADLYGLLFNQIWNDLGSRESFQGVLKSASGMNTFSDSLPEILRDDEEFQAKIFSAIAGRFMGTDPRRGRTYNWLYQHLADAFEQTSPRSFLVAVTRAANKMPAPNGLAIDYNGIKEGVVAASKGRVDELKEDNVWIGEALDDLADLEVPCDPSVFIQRWKSSRTVNKIEVKLRSSIDRPGPLAFEERHTSKEHALLISLIGLGVIEPRAADRINMPDLFRVAARIKRRGGVKPPIRG